MNVKDIKIAIYDDMVEITSPRLLLHLLTFQRWRLSNLMQ